jgi:hypothetical protein
VEWLRYLWGLSRFAYFGNLTGHIWREKEKPEGPLLLQADHGPVAFRNVSLQPLPAAKQGQP